MEKYYPCDHEGTCPYDAYGSDTCRNMCGLGVNEDSYPEEENEDA